MQKKAGTPVEYPISSGIVGGYPVQGVFPQTMSASSLPTAYARVVGLAKPHEVVLVVEVIAPCHPLFRIYDMVNIRCEARTTRIVLYSGALRVTCQHGLPGVSPPKYTVIELL